MSDLVSFYHRQVPSFTPAGAEAHQWHRRTDGAGENGGNPEMERCLRDEDDLHGTESDRKEFCDWAVSCIKNVWFPYGLAGHRKHCARIAHSVLASKEAKRSLYAGCAASQIDHIECYFNWLTIGGFNYTRTDIPGYMLYLDSDRVCRKRIPAAEYPACIARATGSTGDLVDLVNNCQFVTCSDQTPELFEVCVTNCYRPLVDNVILKQAKAIEAKLSVQPCGNLLRLDETITLTNLVRREDSTTPSKRSGATKGAHPTAALARVGLLLIFALAHGLIL